MKAAKAVGLIASSSLLVRADEVIEGPRRLLALRDILQRRASSVAKPWRDVTRRREFIFAVADLLAKFLNGEDKYMLLSVPFAEI
jgi:hypothetical protein